jgi:hypothetical protein
MFAKEFDESGDNNWTEFLIRITSFWSTIVEGFGVKLNVNVINDNKIIMNRILNQINIYFNLK